MRLKRDEKLFKLTLYELAEDEIPDKLYGDDPKDSYQDSQGITPSARMIPADIPDRLIIRRTEKKIDPTKQLLEAGYPFSHIGTELVNLHGKFEVVSKDVMLLKDEFSKVEKDLENKIETETATLSRELKELSGSVGTRMREFFTEQFEAFFDRKTHRIYGTLVTIAGFGLAVYHFVLGSTPSTYQAWVFLAIGFLALLFTLLLTKK